MSYETLNADANLEAHWKLDETTGTTAEDAKNSYDGSCTNFDFSDSGKSVAGLVSDGGNALSLNGTDERIALTGLPTMTDYSFSCRVKPDVVDIERMIFAFSNSRHIRVESSGAVSYAGAVTTSAGALAADVEAHVGATISGTTCKVYVDGVEAASGTVSAVATLANAFIGWRETRDHWSGVIDDVMLFSRTLTPTEMAEIAAGPTAQGDQKSKDIFSSTIFR